ncbi:hypothetical protein [Dactylosporangium sp. NPDC051484]|uniref:hypothetical protein n=1 Tax=Dactylosporangium sp. NPDC051484 TaxID=3154942 RepID=UPI00344B3068
MARRSFTVAEVTDILLLWHEGRTINQLSSGLGVDRKTIRKYLAPAIATGHRPGGEPVPAAQWAARVEAWFPRLSNPRLRRVAWPELDRHAQFVRAQLAAGAKQSAIWRRLRDEHALAVSVATFRRWVRATLPPQDGEPPAGASTSTAAHRRP